MFLLIGILATLKILPLVGCTCVMVALVIMIAMILVILVDWW